MLNPAGQLLNDAVFFFVSCCVQEQVLGWPAGQPPQAPPAQSTAPPHTQSSQTHWTHLQTSATSGGALEVNFTTHMDFVILTSTLPTMRFLFSCAGSGFSSKPSTPTGPSPFMPPMGSPSRPPPSPQHTAGFPSWQPGPGSGGGWQAQGQGTPPQPKPSPSHTPMTHNSPQNRPNYNVTFSPMGGGSPTAGSKAQAGMGEKEMMKPI